MVELHEQADVASGGRPELTSELVWRQIARNSFAVLSYVTPAGGPRSTGVLYATARHRLFVAVAPDSWKARHLSATGGRVAVTVPVRRGGLLSLVLPIPPATISFRAATIVHPQGALDIGSLSSELAALVPAERLAVSRIIEIVPEGQFLTYGIGTPLMRMRNPDAAKARVPVG